MIKITLPILEIALVVFTIVRLVRAVLVSVVLVKAGEDLSRGEVIVSECFSLTVSYSAPEASPRLHGCKGRDNNGESCYEEGDAKQERVLSLPGTKLPQLQQDLIIVHATPVVLRVVMCKQSTADPRSSLA